ncbi:quinol monooxygenase YgiN [Pseudomonas citronellolis]|uniref:putative quinol monooxygenase n=1 Tax=Pseudomonas citronellolis TaxID=53408 RepID=UPI00209EA314|nr:putative quinol monooxygenase [Pseudomonas citronellolis]MCP1644983.1 quinol monooxygenase YgiN [Pseudomonas citronellolis]MCP1668017.1 quinol monooxygenase YgiN [Pseudomonas citronellolis]MCP1699137.1 quinol monooxygenase YgiN [Pseudomonas citronellolis]MCP1705668.1 quinol monooxygenase YgiN [Pseudomonas citronellolis]MCP1799701.1 quinol monooxygenase YgiN [Pseudomonas citronellolis]
MNYRKPMLELLVLLLAWANIPAAHARDAERQNLQDTTVNICALMRPKKGKADELRQSLTALVGPTNKEEGHIAYNIFEEGNGSIFLHEVWRSQADLERHLQKPYIRAFVSKTQALLDGENEAHFGRVISSLANPRFTERDAHGSGTVHICSVKRPVAGKAHELRQALLALAEPTSHEEGYLAYNLYEEKDGSLFLYEAWRSRQDLASHFQKPYIKAFQARVGDLTTRNDVHVGTMIPIVQTR